MGATAHNPAGRVSTGGASRCRHVIDPIWRDRRSFYFRSRLATRESTVQTDLRSVSESVIYKMPDRHSGAARRRPALTRPRARVGAYTTQRARRERHGAERRRRGVARGRASRPEVRRERRDVLHPGMRVPLRRERGSRSRRRTACCRIQSWIPSSSSACPRSARTSRSRRRRAGSRRGTRARARSTSPPTRVRHGSARPSRANDGAARLEVSARTGRARREGVAAGRRARTPRPRASRSSRRGKKPAPARDPNPARPPPTHPRSRPRCCPPPEGTKGSEDARGEKIQENLDRDTPETRGRDPIDPIACVASSCSLLARAAFFFLLSVSPPPPPPLGPRASNPPARTPPLPLISVHAGLSLARASRGLRPLGDLAVPAGDGSLLHVGAGLDVQAREQRRRGCEREPLDLRLPRRGLQRHGVLRQQPGHRVRRLGGRDAEVVQGPGRRHHEHDRARRGRPHVRRRHVRERHAEGLVRPLGVQRGSLRAGGVVRTDDRAQHRGRRHPRAGERGRAGGVVPGAVRRAHVRGHGARHDVLHRRQHAARDLVQDPARPAAAGPVGPEGLGGPAAPDRVPEPLRRLHRREPGGGLLRERVLCRLVRSRQVAVRHRPQTAPRVQHVQVLPGRGAPVAVPRGLRPPLHAGDRRAERRAVLRWAR